MHFVGQKRAGHPSLGTISQCKNAEAEHRDGKREVSSSFRLSMSRPNGVSIFPQMGRLSTRWERIKADLWKLPGSWRDAIDNSLSKSGFFTMSGQPRTRVIAKRMKGIGIVSLDENVVVKKDPKFQALLFRSEGSQHRKNYTTLQSPGWTVSSSLFSLVRRR